MFIKSKLKKLISQPQVASRNLAFILLSLLILFTAAGFAEPIPTIEIIAVEAGKSVTIRTHNFPANQTFTVTVGKMGTKGVGGVVAGTFNSGVGGTANFTFPIPAAVQGYDKIAIRAETAHLFPYYSYNWFHNSNAGTPPPTTGQPPIVTTLTPTFTITGVKRNQSVTFQTYNFPANQQFTVTMGKMGTKGVGGIVAGSFASGSGGSFPVTVNIPAQVQGLNQIAIRAQTSHASPYYSYNWFYNNSTQ